jgi:hypothetical protein
LVQELLIYWKTLIIGEKMKKTSLALLCLGALSISPSSLGASWNNGDNTVDNRRECNRLYRPAMKKLTSGVRSSRIKLSHLLGSKSKIKIPTECALKVIKDGAYSRIDIDTRDIYNPLDNGNFEYNDDHFMDFLIDALKTNKVSLHVSLENRSLIDQKTELVELDKVAQRTRGSLHLYFAAQRFIEPSSNASDQLLFDLTNRSNQDNRDSDKEAFLDTYTKGGNSIARGTDLIRDLFEDKLHINDVEKLMDIISESIVDKKDSAIKYKGSIEIERFMKGITKSSSNYKERSIISKRLRDLRDSIREEGISTFSTQYFDIKKFLDAVTADIEMEEVENVVAQNGQQLPKNRKAKVMAINEIKKELTKRKSGQFLRVRENGQVQALNSTLMEKYKGSHIHLTLGKSAVQCSDRDKLYEFKDNSSFKKRLHYHGLQLDQLDCKKDLRL